MAFLHVEHGELKGEIISLNQDKLVLGRDPDVALQISKKKSVSRRHAQILCLDGRYFIEDCESRGGTYVNGEKVSVGLRRLLKHKDRIGLCEFQASFLDGVTEEEAGESTSTVEVMLGPKSDHRLETQPAAKLAVLLEITAQLSKTLQLDEQLPEVAKGLLKLFPHADRSFLILEDPETGVPMPKVVQVRSGVEAETELFSGTIVRKCLQSAEAILFRVGDPISPQSDSVISSRMRSVMCVPLCPSEGRPFGVIQLDTHDEANKFTEEDLRLLRGVSQQASIALENSRYHALHLAQELDRSEMEVAQEVQLNFLPQRLPVLEGYEFYAHYEAARKVGGDYYDFIALPDGNLAVAIGDVAGKGTPAALLMARLSSECRTCFLTEREPTTAVGKLNQQLYSVTSPMGRFVTLAAAVLDPVRHTLSMVHAGHPVPLLRRRGAVIFSRAILAEHTGPLLGASPSGEFFRCQVELNPGDCLLLYSDGVTDALDKTGKSFRLGGIEAVLDSGADATPRELGERIIRAVQTHAQGRAPFDDVTLICLGRLPAKA